MRSRIWALLILFPLTAATLSACSAAIPTAQEGEQTLIVTSEDAPAAETPLPQTTDPSEPQPTPRPVSPPPALPDTPGSAPTTEPDPAPTVTSLPAPDPAATDESDESVLQNTEPWPADKKDEFISSCSATADGMDQYCFCVADELEQMMSFDTLQTTTDQTDLDTITTAAIACVDLIEY